MHHVALLSALLTDDSALGSRINECLNRVAVYFSFNVKHSDLTKKFGAIFKCVLIVALDQALSNFFFNLLLGLCVIWVGIHQLIKASHFCPFSLHLLFQPLSNDLEDFRIIICSDGATQFRVLIQYVMKLRRIVTVMLFDPCSLPLDLAVHLIIKSLVKVVRSTDASLGDLLGQVSEERIQ